MLWGSEIRVSEPHTVCPNACAISEGAVSCSLRSADLLRRMPILPFTASVTRSLASDVDHLRTFPIGSAEIVEFASGVHTGTFSGVVRCSAEPPKGHAHRGGCGLWAALGYACGRSGT